MVVDTAVVDIVVGVEKETVKVDIAPAVDEGRIVLRREGMPVDKAAAPQEYNRHHETAVPSVH